MCDVKIQGYAAEMDNPAMAHLIPSNLHSKKDILFGNMPEIYQFHKRYAFKLIDYICWCFTNVVHSLSIYTSLSRLKDISEGTGSIHWLPRAGGPLLFRTGEHFYFLVHRRFDRNPINSNVSVNSGWARTDLLMIVFAADEGPADLRGLLPK